MHWRRESPSLRSHFGDHQLRRCHTESRHFGQPSYRVLVRLQGLGNHVVESADLLFEQLQTFQVELELLLMHQLRSSG